MPNQQPNIDFLIQLSKEAGKILKEGFGKEHQVSYKGPINIVTEIDRKSEDMLVERIRGAFPKHSIVAEESGFLDGAERPPLVYRPGRWHFQLRQSAADILRLHRLRLPGKDAHGGCLRPHAR